MQKQLMDLELEELAALLAGWGEPPYRAKQVYAWLMRGARPGEMLNIPKALRERLGARPYGGADIIQKLVSREDGTAKYLFRLEDGELMEGVLMPYRHGNTLCLSTQVGCRMGCAFCASTLAGLKRNGTAGEMLSQVLAVERAQQSGGRERIVSNLVLMGSGEPLDNVEQVFAFLHRAVDADGLHIGARNISLSTCGIVPAIERMAKEAPPVTLCISLHAHADSLRDVLVPVNKKYPIRAVLAAAKGYAHATGRRIIIEYALMEGVNASMADAQGLSRLLKGMLCHVNLIPLNPVPERNLKGVSRSQAIEFNGWLTERGISATVRRQMGADIEGACGQLRRRYLMEGEG